MSDQPENDQPGSDQPPADDDAPSRTGVGAPSPVTGDRHRSDRSPVWRDELVLAAEVSALVGFAVTQPVLGPFGESPQTFVAAEATRTDIVVFGLLASVVPAVVVAGTAALTRLLGPRVRSWVQTGLVAVLAGLALVVVARSAGAGPVVRSLVAVVAVAGVAWLHRRWDSGRAFLRFASPAPVLFLALFLLASPVAPLVRSGDGGATDRASGDHAPVVVIVLDELPTRSLVADGEVDADLFPALARLAATSTWYRNHSSVASQTAVALPALVTGRIPEETKERPAVADVYPENLLTLLAETHDVHAVEWITDLCPDDACPDDGPTAVTEDAAALLSEPVGGREGAVTRLLGDAVPLWWGQAWPGAEAPSTDYEVTGLDDVAEQARPALEFLSGLDGGDGERPVLDYLHAPIPHQPWRLLPGGQSYSAPNPPMGLEFTVWGDDSTGRELAAAARVRHLLQMQWADRMVGAVIDRLEELGRWDDAAVVVTADHGVSFRAGQPARTLTPGNAADIAWTPLFIKAPGQTAPEVDDGNVLSVDVLPTVAEMAGVDLPWDTDGRSLVDGADRGDGSKPILAPDPDAFDDRIDGDVVDAGVDGLRSLLAVEREGSPSDELRVWRHGRHRDLLGRTVDGLGVCRETGPDARYRPPARWASMRRNGASPLPLWHHGTIDADDATPLVAAVDGTVVATGTSRPTSHDGNQIGLLMTLPLVEDQPSVPRLYQVVDGEGCRLRRLGGDG